MYDRIVGKDLPSGRKKILGHQFCACLHEYRRGEISANKLAQKFDLVGDSVFRTIVKKLDSLLLEEKKIDFVMLIGDMIMLAEREMDFTTRRAFLHRINKFK